MPISKAQMKAVAKYTKNNYDTIQLRVPKGKRDIIRTHAEAHSESINAFISRAIDETIERDEIKARIENGEYSSTIMR